MPRDMQDIDWPALIDRVHAGERARDVAREFGLDGRVLRMRALHADPAFAEAHRERVRALHADPAFAEAHRERMRALHADPAFAEAHRERMRALNADPAHNPLVLLSEPERADYDTLKANGYSRAEALLAIGRPDLTAAR